MKKSKDPDDPEDQLRLERARARGVEIKNMRESLRLKSSELARSLNVAAFTLRRWEDGSSAPVGLQSEVLQGLIDTVGRVSPERARTIGTQMLGGFGRMIVALLAKDMFVDALPTESEFDEPSEPTPSESPPTVKTKKPKRKA